MRLNVGLVTSSAIAILGCAAPAPEPAPLERAATGPVARALGSSLRDAPTLARRWLDARGGFHVEGTSFARAADLDRPSLAPLSIRLGARGDAPLRIARADDPDASLTLTPLDLAPAPATLEDGRVRVVDVRPGVDAIHLATGGGAESLYVLRDASAPISFAWRVERGASLVEVRDDGDGGLSLRDARGRERLFVERPFAVDARGARREASLRLIADRLEIELDPRGLTAPVVLDPYVGAARWQRMSVSPSARYSTSMTDVGGALIVFGGQGSVVLGDTWAWNGQRWTELHPATSPSARVGAAFGSLGGKGILYGGVDATLTKRLDDTWSFDGTTWTQLSPAHKPPPNVYGSLAHAGGKLVLLGGKGQLGSTWVFDGTDWSENTTTPQPTFDGSGAGGVFTDDGASAWFVGAGATWSFDGARWTDRSAGAGTPSSPVILVRLGGKLLLWAGVDDYEWSGSAWTLRPRVDLPQQYKNAMLFATAPYDGGVALFGGRVIAGALDDFLRLDTTGVSRPFNHAVPSGRVFPCFATVGDRAVLFGGWNGGVLGDTWELDGKAWSEKKPANSPSPRQRAACAEGPTDTALLFGGGVDATVNDTWIWDHATWTQKKTATSPFNDGAPRLARVGAENVLLAYETAYHWTGSDWGKLAGKVPSRIGTVVTGADWSVFSSYAGKGALVVPEMGTQWSYDGTAWISVDPVGIAPIGGPGVTSPILGNAGIDLGARLLLLGTRLGQNTTEAWLWDGASWAALAPDGLPPLAVASAAKVGGKVALFGGLDPTSQASSDTYLLQVALANGVTCGGDGDCESGHCAQGVCCNAACTEAAQSCVLPSTRGTCAPILAACVDASTLQAADGSTSSCAPYVCTAGACPKSCATSADCLGGYGCDDASHTCAPLAATSGGSEGGCALSSSSAPSGVRAWLAGGLALAVAAAVRARRRSRA
jgi:hypothetical protein